MQHYRQTSPPISEVIAAQIAVLRQTCELTLAGYLARDYSKNPVVLLQLALALMDEKPRQEMAAAHAAADILSESQIRSSAQWDEDLYPFVQVLMARLYHLNGNRSRDHASAIQAIRNALSTWEDEPRWHYLAAQIFIGHDGQEDLIDMEEAVSHLEHAIQLDVHNGTRRFQLHPAQPCDPVKWAGSRQLEAHKKRISLRWIFSLSLHWQRRSSASSSRRRAATRGSLDYHCKQVSRPPTLPGWQQPLIQAPPIPPFNQKIKTYQTIVSRFAGI